MHTMRPTANKIVSVITQRGYKITAQRRAVIDVVVSSRKHLAPSAVHEMVRLDCPAIGLVTVYRTLEMLYHLGLICRVHQEGKSYSYTLDPSGHHHHLVCTDCGTVVDFTDCPLEEMEQRIATETGFVIDDHLLQFAGHCQDCRK